MGRASFITLFIAALLVALLAAALQTSPGYMDADYYYAGALRIASGEGDSEPYLWNYLNGFHSLPAPAFAYWMPLTALLAAAGMALTGSTGFWAARVGFILLAALIPPFTAWFSYRLTARAGLAKLSGVLAIFSGFYLAYITTTDAFPIYMLLGSLFLVVVGGEIHPMRRWPVSARFFVLGILTGLLHMARADGLVWLAGIGLAGIEELRCRTPQASGRRQRSALRALAAYGGAALAGYAPIASFWFARNLRVWGSLFPPGGSRALWITDYPQTMSFPAAQLTFEHWLSAGWGTHLEGWFTALLNHLQTALAVQGTIVLFPFILIGLWKLRGRFEVRLGAAMWLIILLVMTLVFPYAGANGGFFHSGAALQPLFWAAAPLGIESAARWYAEKRRLSTPRNILRFANGLVVAACVLLTVFLYFQRVFGSEPASPRWSADMRHYRAVEDTLLEFGADPAAPVLVNNPPGYWLASGRPAVVIPAGDEHTLRAAAQQFDVGYLVFEPTNPVELADLYHGRVSLPELEYLTSFEETKLYRFHWNGAE